MDTMSPSVTPTGPIRVMEYLAIVYRRTWRASVVSSFVNPLFFLLAMGVGLGSLVDAASAPDAGDLGGVAYLSFLAPALLATTAMQTAAIEASWPVFGNIKFTRTYYAMLATPLGVNDIVLGQLGWTAVRVTQACAAYFVVMTICGATESPWALLAIPAGVLTGLAFACPLAAYSAVITRETSLVAVQRFGLVPLFLFSGTFFPVTELPAWLRPVAYATPLWHGVDLCRDLALGRFDGSAVIGHVLYLGAWIVVGVLLACRTLRRRLVT